MSRAWPNPRAEKTKLTKPARDRISATKFAFPKQREEPLENASHVQRARSLLAVSPAAFRNGSYLDCLS